MSDSVNESKIKLTTIRNSTKFGLPLGAHFASALMPRAYGNTIEILRIPFFYIVNGVTKSSDLWCFSYDEQNEAQWVYYYAPDFTSGGRNETYAFESLGSMPFGSWFIEAEGKFYCLRDGIWVCLEEVSDEDDIEGEEIIDDETDIMAKMRLYTDAEDGTEVPDGTRTYLDSLYLEQQVADTASSNQSELTDPDNKPKDDDKNNVSKKNSGLAVSLSIAAIVLFIVFLFIKTR